MKISKTFLVLFSFIFSFALFAQINNQIVLNKSLEKFNDLKIINMPVQSGEQDDNKIDPLLRLFISDVNTSKGNNWKLYEKYTNQTKLLAFSENYEGKIVVPVLIRSTDITSTAANIKAIGGIISTIAGDIITAEVLAESIKDLSHKTEVIYIEGSHLSEPLLNVSHVEIGADKVHNGTGLPQSYKGEGVIVGVIDSGIDWAHEDFKNSSGTRIKYLWDMSSSGNPPSGFSYGTEYTKTQMDAGQCNEIDGDDGHGHGTHVASTAAGDDNALTGYTGIAPASDIIFVKGYRDEPTFSSTDVINGCSYIFTKSASLGKPCVINLSLGGHYGPHDGSSLYEQSLSNLTGPGKIIVAAAGNEGGDQIHLSYTTGGQSLSEVRQTIWVIPAGVSGSYADFWYLPGNISVGLAAYDANFNLLGATNGISPGQKVENAPFTTNGGQTLGIVTIDATTLNDPNNGKNRVFIGIESNNGQYNLNAVYWSLFTYGTGTFDAWILGAGYFTTDSNPASFLYPGDNNKSVGQPATSKKVICIGSYVTKNQWIDIDGATQTQPGNPTIGKISDFSSLGPTADNRMKPDISAPGEVILAALSHFLTISPNHTPRSSILQGGKHKKMNGTSMASPHVTGTVALMLQRNPNLDYDQALTILTSTARKDNFTGSSQNNTYGHGKLDAYNAVLSTSGGGPQPTIILSENFDAASFPPAGWTQQTLNTNYTWGYGNPSNNNFNLIDPTSVYSATCMWVAANQDEWLITPSFLLGSGTASLEFYAGYSTQYLPQATIKLHISTNGGSNWQKIWEAENDGEPWKWRKKTIDLSGYANQQNLKLAWQYVGNDGDLAGLDGIRLTGTLSDVVEIFGEIPEEFEVSYNYPNPFNPSTKIRYALPEGRDVKVVVYDILGEKVTELVNNFQDPGTYEVTWNGKNNYNQNVASGTYILRITAGDYVQNRKMNLIK